MKVFFSGLATGLILQLAIGPVFFYIANLTLQKTSLDGLVAVLAVTLADYIYISLAILGVGKLFEKKGAKRLFGMIGSIVLVLFGLIIIKTINKNPVVNAVHSASLFASFSSAFFLTISSPMTIVFWTGLFAAKAAERSYTKKELIFFGLAAGLATLIFMGLSVIILSFAKQSIPIQLIIFLNILVGFLLIVYGLIRLSKSLKNT